MVVDTSAIIAILLGEPDQAEFAAVLAASTVRLISAVTRVELSIVIEGRNGAAGRADLERLLDAVGFEVVSVTLQQADVAVDAFRRFGKGQHPAALNMGDCFSYALASERSQPLLFKGNDFSRTDIRPAKFPP